MNRREASHEPPAYRGLKRRCDFCDQSFKVEDMVVCLPMRFEAGGRPYELTFCFKGGDLPDFQCMRKWLYIYEIKVGKLVDDAVFKIYHGKHRDGGGDKTGDPAYI